MRKKIDIIAEAPGQDSFLDVVANLVGIMIILIMVVGVATKKAIVDGGIAASIPAPESEVTSPAPPDDTREMLQRELEESRRASDAVEIDIEKTNVLLEREKFEVVYRRRERDKVLERLAAAERLIAAKRETLDATKQVEFDLTSQLNAARAELRDIELDKEAVKTIASPPGVIEHLPTPMAKTVFGKEIHLRMLGGRVAYVPWDELVERLKADAPNKAQRMRDTPTITETIGPVQGFWMRYTLRRADQSIRTAAGTATQTRIELSRFVIMPEVDGVGEPIEQALAPQSGLRSMLQSLDPTRTTLTVWIYPDSFGKYRELKQELFRMGFLTAARPLPEGHPIGGSPDGSRSSAQ